MIEKKRYGIWERGIHKGLIIGRKKDNFRVWDGGTQDNSGENIYVVIVIIVKQNCSVT